MKSLFPIFKPISARPPLIYLDSAASSQVPASVLDRVTGYYSREHSNIHRGVHFLAESATEAYEKCRSKVKQFLNAPDDSHIIFTSGTTHAVNLAAAIVETRIEPGDLIVCGPLEHHSNFLPWLSLARKKGAVIFPYKTNSDLQINPQSIPYDNPRLKLIAVTRVSNVTGGIQPISEIVQHAKNRGILTFADGAQAIAHLPIDLSQTEVDFYAFSGHKMYAMTGVGVLYAAPSLLTEVKPYMSGGGMVEDVNYTNFSSLPPPQKFEAGTPNISGVVSLSAAIDFLLIHKITTYSKQTMDLVHQAIKGLNTLGDLHIFADPDKNAGIVSFSHSEIHPHDIAGMLSQKGICIRAGHHCAKLLMEQIGEKATCRLSLACYNDKKDIEKFLGALAETLEFFRK